jgi:N-acetylmuramoyl-L-alanine amidase
VELEERADTANRASANLFLSIHTNSSPKASASGFSVYIAYAAGQTSVAAATDIANRVEQAGIASCGSQPKRAGYKVLVQNHRPAVLLEMGFITNSADVSNLSQARYQRMLADAVAEGIADYLRGR